MILSVQPTPDPMSRFPLSMASRLSDRQTVWISAADNAKNSDGRPSQFVHWGVPTTVLAAQYATAHAASVREIEWD